MEFSDILLIACRENKVITICMVVLLLDTFFGIMRAIKEKRLNSAIGIDGIIRKVSMIVAVIAMAFIDWLIGFNAIGWLPEFILDILKGMGIEVIGFKDVIAILFCGFEILSISKNWILIGLPLPKVAKDKIAELMEFYTDELPTTKKN